MKEWEIRFNKGHTVDAFTVMKALVARAATVERICLVLGTTEAELKQWSRNYGFDVSLLPREPKKPLPREKGIKLRVPASVKNKVEKPAVEKQALPEKPVIERKPGGKREASLLTVEGVTLSRHKWFETLGGYYREYCGDPERVTALIKKRLTTKDFSDPTWDAKRRHIIREWISRIGYIARKYSDDALRDIVRDALNEVRLALDCTDGFTEINHHAHYVVSDVAKGRHRFRSSPTTKAGQDTAAP